MSSTFLSNSSLAKAYLRFIINLTRQNMTWKLLLTKKFWWPKFFHVPNIFQKLFMYQTFLLTNNFRWPKIFADQEFFTDQNFLLTKTFCWPKFSADQNFSLTTIFSLTKIFAEQYFSLMKNFLTKHFFDQIFFDNFAKLSPNFNSNSSWRLS